MLEEAKFEELKNTVRVCIVPKFKALRMYCMLFVQNKLEKHLVRKRKKRAAKVRAAFSRLFSCRAIFLLLYRTRDLFH